MMYTLNSFICHICTKVTHNPWDRNKISSYISYKPYSTPPNANFVFQYAKLNCSSKVIDSLDLILKTRFSCLEGRDVRVSRIKKQGVLGY